jgi:hypothetical protein
MKVKISEAKDQVLDGLVAQCEGIETKNYSGALTIRYDGDWWQPSTDWAQGGPIIEREGITVSRTDKKSDEGPWVAYRIEHLFEDEYEHEYQHGPTPLIAAMRCYVASKLGDEVEMPPDFKHF